QLRGYSFDEIKTLFKTTIRRVNTFVPIESEVDKAVLELAAGSSKRDAEEELDQEIPEQGMNVEALQTKYLIIEYDIYTQGTRKDDLVMLWSLVKERFNSTEPIDDKERETWVKLKREGNRHLYDGREGVSIVKRNSYIDTGCKALGESEPLSYNDLRPLSSLDEGLYLLACDEDVHCLANLVRSFKLLENDSSTPTKNSVYESVTPRFMPHGSSIEIYGLGHDESFRVDDLDLHLNLTLNLNVRVDEVVHAWGEEAVVHGRGEEDVKQGNGTYDDHDLLLDKENEIVEPNVDVHLFGII
ncbi:hypothetical protein Tco_0772649, partial [Tanacetum coccineum]